jgi:uncharacterized protein (TIGR02217 family)
VSFHDVRIDDGLIIYDSDGGPEFSTEITPTATGNEKRQENYEEGLGSWDIGERMVTGVELKAIETFFRARKGRAYSFRWKDWGDYIILAAEGRIGATAAGAGVPTYDLWRRLSDSAGDDDRRIWLLVATTFAGFRNGSPVAEGAGAGEISSVDLVNGQVTFIADATSGATSITPGATTEVILTTNPGTLIAGELLYLSAFAGADAGFVNGLAHTINTVAGTGPFTFTLATDTAGKTITLGSGVGAKYPQVADALTFSAQFDKPVRFGSDKLTRKFIVRDGANTLFELAPLPIVETIEP